MRKIVATTSAILLTLTMGVSTGLADDPVSKRVATKMKGDELMKPVPISKDILDRHATWQNVLDDRKGIVRGPGDIEEDKRARGESEEDFDMQIKDLHPRYQKVG
ncbi:exported hypothetical protein [Nitrospina gracilis 3/211]|uniref:Uncharacterized protein n=1 Tax=Nitrospina gracilis (strain 3/211) TaxID=1266370 RepID=M1Z0Q9_NITG3|nr:MULTISPECIES: hypothetical protein [Nitrospina]MCF8723979.1 hypothetical protein [Nitrospina sp. Nb-3]CCQ91103.1 exported hypothetical protein [Nitrospina gracilis 3/211]